VLAPTIGVDRPIKADVGRVVAGQDGLGALDRDRCAAPRNAVERLDLIEPFALGHMLLEVEAGWRRIAGRSASVVRLDWHHESVGFNKKISRTYFRRNHSGDHMFMPQEALPRTAEEAHI